MTYKEQFLLSISPKQNVFIYSPQGYRFNKGTLSGRLVKDLYEENEEGLVDYLYQLYHHDESNYHTQYIIMDIHKEFYRKPWR